jgi:SAM-dependent methyltransferase
MKELLKRLLPECTKRRLVATLIMTLLTQPNRLRHRLNYWNICLYRQFARVKAHCCICGNTGALFFDMPDVDLRHHHGIRELRETLQCKSCGSTNRQRTLSHTLISVLQRQFACTGAALGQLARTAKKIEIWDTDAFSPISARVRSVANITLSKYLPELPFGVEVAPGVFNIDLQKINFESGRFDIILSSDIMEHVRDDRTAHAEIFRCLRPGGTYIFTVPYIEDRSRTVRLVDTSSAQDIFLVPPHYHGDPITGNILAYRIYGRDLIQQLESVGFEVRFLWIELSAEGIFSGDCFIATRPEPVSVGEPTSVF